MSILIKLFMRINLIPASFCQKNGKIHFSWFSFRTIFNLSVSYGLGLSCLIYYTQMNYVFVKGTPMEYARLGML
mgnify:CR=1 FL=1